MSDIATETDPFAEEREFAATLTELFHTLSARVVWPDEALKTRFEERVGRLEAIMQRLSAGEEETEPPEHSGVYGPGDASEVAGAV